MQLSLFNNNIETKKLESQVLVDDYTKEISKVFDYDFDGKSSFEPIVLLKEDLPEDFNIGLIVGASGSGKSTLLKDFGQEEDITWDNSKCIASNFDNPQDAIDRLSAVGLSSIPTWVKPYRVLSNGEKFRADLARRLKNNAVIDEFTSVVDRNVAKACCVSLCKYIKKKNIKNIVFASCHKDIVEWLEPDWVYDTDTKNLSVRGCLRRPIIHISVYETEYSTWHFFKRHHYLNHNLNKCAKCFVATWNDVPVAFSGNLPMPGYFKPLYKNDTRYLFRESRLVVLPDYQGMGIGTRFSNTIADYFLNLGYRYFSKTAHVRMGEYRNKSDLWRATSTSQKQQHHRENEELYHNIKYAWNYTNRLCYSHEYIGPKDNKYRIAYEKGFMSEELIDEQTNVQIKMFS